MNKNEFLEQKEVRGFINWLSSKVDGGFKHSWISMGGGHGFKKGEEWVCESLYDAHKRYRWKSKRYDTDEVIIEYDETRDYLISLARKLNEAIDANDAESCLKLCKETLKWGGVDKPNIAKHIKQLGSCLPNYLQEVKAYLNSLSLDTNVEFNFTSSSGKSFGLDLDSGSTKIYSLIAENFIIYDSRVGAALGLLVSTWYSEEHNNTSIPESLKFTWGSARKIVMGKRVETRNPNVNTNTKSAFKNYSQVVPKKRIADNIQSSWLIENLMTQKQMCGNFISIPQAYRCHAFESALFMIGYMVSPQPLKALDFVSLTGRVKTPHKRGSNHAMLNNYITENLDSIPSEFNFNDVKQLSNIVLPNVSEGGKVYATLRFIQSYCYLQDNNMMKSFQKAGDPRKYEHLSSVKSEWCFSLLNFKE